MSSWLIPCNIKVYRVHDYFAQNDIVDWKQSHYKFNAGDVVYIYCCSPEMKIRYKLFVLQPNIAYKDSIKDEKFWQDKHISKSAAEQNRYVRMQLVSSSDTLDLSLPTLVSNGLKKAPQGPCRIEGALLDYIDSHFSQ